jgi:hypothetical protein
MNRRKRILRPYNAVLLVLFAGFLLAVSAQSQQLESLTATAKGHGMISSEVEKREITSALVVLRQNGTFLITVTAELQLQAQGTWKASASSPDEILLKITGGALKGELTGSGKLLLSSDGKSFRQLAVNIKTVSGFEITVTFAADNSKPLE